MPWNNQGGGPWGNPPGGGGHNGNGGGNNPWGNNNRPGGGPRRPGGGGGPPPDFEAILRKGQDRMKSALPGGIGGGGLAVLVLVIVGIWLASGLYRISEGESGVELVLGHYSQTSTPGLRYNWPSPVGEVIVVNVEKNNMIPIGYRTVGGNESRSVPSESLMVTGDQNIIDIKYNVFWRIADPQKFLFEMASPEATAKITTESVMREVIAARSLNEALTERRREIQDEVQIRTQELLDEYGSGIAVLNVEIKEVDPPTQVVEAFRDVVAANNDQETRINEANRYYNEVVPRAQGDAQRLLEEARAYKQQQIARAQGDAQRFTAIYESYKNGKEVTIRRLYLETMEEVLGNTQKIILDSESSGSNGVVPYLPLDRLRSSSTRPNNTQR